MLPTDRYETVLHGHVCHLVHHEGDDAGNVETVGDAGEDTVGGVCGHSSPQNVLQAFSSSALGLVLVLQQLSARGGCGGRKLLRRCWRPWGQQRPDCAGHLPRHGVGQARGGH